jgi:hypothetical protein
MPGTYCCYTYYLEASKIIETNTIAQILLLFIYLIMCFIGKNAQINEETNEVDFPETEKYFTAAVEGIVGWTTTIADALNACETAASSTKNT